ncbi:MAG: undecaprenyl-phosphate glucose phosphotransferase [Acidobacteria bacterium]|nr:undecaprenyl-phosphate glucose phosphotransferase [Acidobacteriota bacterium]
MLKRRARITVFLFASADLLSSILAYLLSIYLRFTLQVVPNTKGMFPIRQYLYLVLFMVAVWPLIFRVHGLYRLRRGRSRIEEVFSIVTSVGLGILIMLATVNYMQVYGRTTFELSHWMLVIFFFANVILTTVGRQLLRYLMELAWKQGKNLLQILIVGAGDVGQNVGERILRHSELGYKIKGYLDDDPRKAGTEYHGIPVIGTTDQFDQIARERSIDLAYIALPIEAHKKILRIVNLASHECLEVRIVPDLLQFMAIRTSLEDIDGMPIINPHDTPLKGWNSVTKRLMDIVFSAAALVGLAIPFGVIAALIKLTSRGPVFYAQERMGMDGGKFMIYKFRSMQDDAEKETGPVWARKDDPRRTGIGSFLRKYSLDELPQFYNVLRGDMSLVGPRPERPNFVEEFKEKIPQYMLRHKVRSGITGWAQVHGWRGNTSIEKRIEYDLYYIENWSLKLDIRILWLTLRRGMRHRNAY